MKKFSLAHQLGVLFFSILVFFFFIIGILFLSRLDTFSQNATYSRLNSYIDGSRRIWTNGVIVDFDTNEFPIGFIQGIVTEEGVEVVYSDCNFGNTFSDSDMNIIMEYLHKGLRENRLLERQGNNSIFYAFEVQNDGQFILVYTNMEYHLLFRKTVSLTVVFLFLIVLTFALIVITFWSKWFVGRIHKIQEHVASLPKTNYSVSYNDNGEDEISQLSRSIENMRFEIARNESIKQEMLQNVSHDFKTPIAVIKSYSEAIIDDMAPIESLNIILQQTDILKNKVNKLLQYNKLEYLEDGKEFNDINMKDVVENVVNTYKYQTDIPIEINLEDVYFKGYQENYYTVVDNILDNAKRYAKNKIIIILKKDKLVIYNDGEHISETFLNGLFKPYEKGYKGQFGLGMSIVKKTLTFFDMNLEVVNEDIGVSFIISKREK